MALRGTIRTHLGVVVVVPHWGELKAQEQTYGFLSIFGLPISSCDVESCLIGKLHDHLHLLVIYL